MPVDRARPVREHRDGKIGARQRAIIRALHHRAVRLARQVEDVKQHDAAAVGHLHREPLPAAMHHGVEVADTADRTTWSLRHRAPCRRASAFRWRPCAAASSSTCSRRTRSCGRGRRSAAPAAPWRRRWSSPGPGSMPARSASRGRGRRRQWPRRDGRAGSRAPACTGPTRTGGTPSLNSGLCWYRFPFTSDTAQCAIWNPRRSRNRPSSFCHHQRRPRRSSRTCCGSRVSSVKAKKHASTPNRRPSAVARCPVQYHHCTGLLGREPSAAGRVRRFMRAPVDVSAHAESRGRA